MRDVDPWGWEEQEKWERENGSGAIFHMGILDNIRGHPPIFFKILNGTQTMRLAINSVDIPMQIERYSFAKNVKKYACLQFITNVKCSFLWGFVAEGISTFPQ